MKITHNVHEQFAKYFKAGQLEPYFYLLSKRLSEGHICVNINKIKTEDFDELYEIPSPPFTPGKFISDGTEKKPLILHLDHLYLHRYFQYETVILQRIAEILEEESNDSRVRIAQIQEHTPFINSMFPQHETEIDWQKVAVILALMNRFTIITGGPGTGKTTTVAKILSVLFHMKADTRVALAAPTGKAASRMAESLKNAAAHSVFGDTSFAENFAALEPSTLHRLLGTSKNPIYFKHNRERPLDYDVFIIDESSMIDVALFAKFLDAVKPTAKVIFLGDKDQLASVEAGSLFGELCTAQGTVNRFSQKTIAVLEQFMPGNLIQDYVTSSTHPLFGHVIELQKSHRFSAQKGIGKLSRAVIQNNKEAVQEFYGNTDESIFLDTAYSEKIFTGFIDGYEEYIREPDILQALKKLNKLKVLCATRQGEFGIYETNRRIEKHLQHKKLIKITGEFYEHRPVMVNQNYYKLGLFNGDTGIVRRNEKGELRIYFEDNGQVKEVPPAFLSAVETVFAMTIHKSQGSEFDEAMIILPQTEEMALLTRELLYTAVTRAKSRVVIQALPQIIEQTMEKQVTRSSGIQERLKNLYAAT